MGCILVYITEANLAFLYLYKTKRLDGKNKRNPKTNMHWTYTSMHLHDGTWNDHSTFLTMRHRCRGKLTCSPDYTRTANTDTFSQDRLLSPAAASAATEPQHLNVREEQAEWRFVPLTDRLVGGTCAALYKGVCVCGCFGWWSCCS